MNYSPQLCLGTVQFGLSYGITNHAGQVPEMEVSRILSQAAASGIDLLDTAQAYGTAEAVVGRYWPKDAPRRLISKLPAGAARETWEENLITSLHRLQASKLDGLLLHRSSDLLAPDGEALLDWLESLRERDLVKRIGVSIYDSYELEGLPLDRLQIVQLPLSIYDQRLLRDGTVEKLKDLDIAIHIRSIFLQGLLLQSPSEWPTHFSTSFRHHHSSWLKFLDDHDVMPLAAALDFVRYCADIEAILVGVASANEFRQLLFCWENSAKPLTNWQVKDWAWNSRRDIDPRGW